MTPRRRTSARREWPDNLHCRDGYYSWRNPIDGREYGIGRDKAEAFRQAMEANVHAAGVMDRSRVIDKLGGTSRRTVGHWLDVYEQRLKKRAAKGKLAKNTIIQYMSFSRQMRRELGASTLMRSVTALMVAERLEAISESGRESAARALRSFMKETFREAYVSGWVDENPIRETRLEAPEVKRARLTLEAFKTVLARTKLDWLRNAMVLALVSAQRREDIAAARFADFREGGWWVVQRKTHAHVFVPLEVRLEAIGLSLADVHRQCRATRVLSKHLVHQTASRGNSPAGQPLALRRLTNAFTAEVKALGRDWQGKKAPTFHEIRGLAARLYARQGDVHVQELLGHKDAKTTELYKDARGAEFIRVSIGRRAPASSTEAAEGEESE